MTRNDLVPRSLTPTELAKLRQEMAEAAAWMRAELRRRRAERDEQTSPAPEQHQE